MSIKGDIFTQISDYLMATLQFNQTVTTDNPNPMPNLQWVDKQMGQFNHPELFNAIPLPAILISFRRTQWDSESRRSQKGEAIITFWVYFENYADSFTGSMNQAKAIQFFDFNELVHQALQGYEGPNFTGLDRVSDEDDEDHDMIIGTVFEYSTVIADDSADENHKYTAVTNKDAKGKAVKTISRPVRPGGDDSNDNEFMIY